MAENRLDLCFVVTLKGMGGDRYTAEAAGARHEFT